MAALTVPLQCADCGNRWEVSPKPDGSMPVTARCPKTRGGCGKLRKVPRGTTAPDSAWNPPAEPRQPRPVDGPCPHCGEHEVYTDPRGVTRYCDACDTLVMPPGVLAPYERGAGVTRAAKSQRERDLESLDLAGRKGVMLGQLRDLAADDRLDPASALKVEWFAEQVKDAASAARLDELAALFNEAGIRRRRWWQGRPAALTAGYADEDQDDDEDDEEEDQDDEPAPVLATPASIAEQQHRAQPRRMTWDDALTASGWRLSPTADGCQIVNERGQLCGAETMHSIGAPRPGYGWVCGPHYGTLGGLITSDYYRQQRGALCNCPRRH